MSRSKVTPTSTNARAHRAEASEPPPPRQPSGPPLSWSLRARERRLVIGMAVAVGLELGAWWVRFLPPNITFALTVFTVFFALLAVPNLVATALRYERGQYWLPLWALLVSFGLIFQIRLGVLGATAPLLRTLASWILAVGVVVAGLALGGSWGILSKRFPPWPYTLGGAAGIYAVLVTMGLAHMGSYYGPGLTTPGEVAKLLLLLATVDWCSRRAVAWDLWGVLFFTGGWMGIIALLALVRDFGSAAILNLVLLSGLYIISRSFALIVAGLAGLGVGSYLLFTRVEYVARRFSGWLSPFSDPEHGSWQLIQSLFALNAGGLWGAGLGGGRPERVPIVVSDFIGSAIAEELGLAGMLVVIGAYMLFGMLAYRLAERAWSYPVSLLAALSAVLICGQALLNLGGVSGLLPITGVTLPFVSKGGTSLVALSVLVGLLIAAENLPGEREAKVRKQPAAGRDR